MSLKIETSPSAAIPPATTSTATDHLIGSSSSPSIDSLRFEAASFHYEGGPEVFSKMSFEVPTGESVLVTGPAGNGQSTFLKLLAVMVQPQSGSFFLNGHDTAQMSFEEFLPFRRRIGYTFDYGGLFANRTLLDNLTLPLLYHKICAPEEAERQARDLGAHFNFSGQLASRPAAVSGGLRKLVCVLRAFVMRPEMIVMDDPFTGVDPASARKIIAMVHERRKSGELRHVFFTSRDEVWPERLGFEPLIIEGGVPRFEAKNQKTPEGKVA